MFVAVSHWMHNAMSQGLLDDPEDAALKLGMHIRLPMLSNDFLHFVAMKVSAVCGGLCRSPMVCICLWLWEPACGELPADWAVCGFACRRGDEHVVGLQACGSTGAEGLICVV